jgi:hypothetical protein
MMRWSSRRSPPTTNGTCARKRVAKRLVAKKRLSVRDQASIIATTRRRVAPAVEADAWRAHQHHLRRWRESACSLSYGKYDLSPWLTWRWAVRCKGRLQQLAVPSARHEVKTTFLLWHTGAQSVLYTLMQSYHYPEFLACLFTRNLHANGSLICFNPCCPLVFSHSRTFSADKDVVSCKHL